MTSTASISQKEDAPLFHRALDRWYDCHSLRNALIVYLAACGLIACSPVDPPSASQVTTPTAIATSSSANLAGEYRDLHCAVVRIQSDHEAGTGFFIDSNGSLVTASHVIFDKSFSNAKPGEIATVNLTAKPGLMMFLPDGSTPIPLKIGAVDANDQRYAGFDLAKINTHRATSCYIPLLIDPNARFDVGQHLISIGYPGSGWQHQVLYEGFLSSIYLQPVQLGLADGHSVIATYPMWRVQMPISAGASGAPLITDSGQAIGVVVETPVPYTEEIRSAIQTYTNDPKKQYSNATDGLRKLVGELAFSDREFLSPGAGLAVSIGVLVLPPLQTSATATAATTSLQH